MFEKMTYKNHLGEEIHFGEDGIFANTSDIHDYKWDVASINNKISKFKKNIQKRTIPVIIACNSESEGIQKRNTIFEVFEKDVLSGIAGKLIIGDYYFKCYITDSKKSNYLNHRNYMELDLEAQSEHPYWIKENLTKFATGEFAKGSDMDYNSDFPFDYSSNLRATSLMNSSFADSNFRLIVFGECVNPTVIIAGHPYTVNATIKQGEYLTVDSIEKKIFLTKSDCTTENCFNLRDRESYIFEKIPPGRSEVSSTSDSEVDFAFEITVYDERGEPKWT